MQRNENSVNPIVIPSVPLFYIYLFHQYFDICLTPFPACDYLYPTDDERERKKEVIIILFTNLDCLLMGLYFFVISTQLWSFWISFPLRCWYQCRFHRWMKVMPQIVCASKDSKSCFIMNRIFDISINEQKSVCSIPTKATLTTLADEFLMKCI